MKRNELIRLISQKGARLLRHGGSHDIYTNPLSGAKIAVPRHSEIKEITAKAIIKKLTP